jgi:hypothetical protein
MIRRIPVNQTLQVNSVRRKAMLRQIYLSAAVVAALAMPATEALSGSASGSPGRYRVGYHHNYDVGYYQGYERGFRRGYDSGTSYRRSANGVAAPPAAAFGAALLGATYGYWGDGYRTYGGDPCYVYNDRDWDWDRVC